jgi:hypothetical protein
MRRLAAPVLAVFLLAGCSGEQGERAQQLLNRAQTAQAGLTSMSYEMQVAFTLEGQRVTLVMDGGAYLKGRRAGEQIMDMRMEGLPGLDGMNLQMVLRGGRMTTTLNGRSSSATVPVSARGRYGLSGTMTELTRYVKEVRVREGRVVNGEHGATVSGVLDTQGLIKAVTRFQSFSRATGQAAPDLSDLVDNVGDTRAALFISGRTGLIRSAVVGLTVDDDNGETIDVEVTYRLASVNRAIAGL